ncbi:MFS transporter [Streptomyces millisiae]|uniref:MFS transporter n=1 Tax=Streptomyces millisiae TaxID=3075542 RepID=A0ABU2M1N6_9ACTN|nr:MFS transporter [Streptomyces sp. DSM 44918]MDT0323188.1 MFS transporter [Streptomyces sp. DSM 44918]
METVRAGTAERSGTRSTGATLPTRRSYAIWAVGVLAYAFSIMQRTTLGVSGLEAAEHFAVSPTQLSTFVFVQVIVYVSMQIPAGLLVDRWGARVTVCLSGTVAAAGQFLLAFAGDLTTAILARVVVGMGDGLMFVSVLALLPRWFPAHRVPLVTQLTTILGQLGQILSALPFLALLRAAGWSTAFGSAASLSLLGAVLALAVLRDAPPGSRPARGGVPARAVLGQLGEIWRRPGTRLGFFGHMATQFSMMAFSLLWGVPYLVSAQGLSASAASGLLTLFVLGTIAVGPVLGVLTTRHPTRRSWLLLGVLGSTVAVWTVLLALPGRAPFWLLVVLIVVLSAGGPGSVVGFDIARTTNPAGQLGVAQSMVNLGGFTASLAVLVSMGVVLDAAGGYTFDAFRLAWLVQYPFWALSLTGLLVTRRKARRVAAAASVAD